MEKYLRFLGIDIAKQIFYVVGMDETGNIVLRKCLPRGALMPFMAQLSPVVIGMEAWGGRSLLGAALP
jgi:transposase